MREDDLLALPLLADGEALGAVVAAGLGGRERDEQLLASFADLAAVALANERRLALSNAEARRDPLTGLANRRAFEERLHEELARGAPFGLAVVVYLPFNVAQVCPPSVEAST